MALPCHLGTDQTMVHDHFSLSTKQPISSFQWLLEHCVAVFMGCNTAEQGLGKVSSHFGEIKADILRQKMIFCDFFQPNLTRP